MAMDSDLEVVTDTFEDLDDGDQDFDTPEVEADEIENSEIDTEEHPEEDVEDEAPEGDEADTEEADSEDQAIVTLDDGTEVTLAELKRGHFREADYTQKTTELAREREQLATERETYRERAQFAETTLSNLTTYLETLVPPEPHASLAQTNPNEYTAQKALRESAIAELGQLIQMKDEFGQAQQGYSQDDIARLRREEDAKLLKAMPHLSDPGKRAVFDKAIKETASEFGFSEDEIAGAADHRILQLVHYAKLGKKAEANRNNAKRRVENPKKGKTRPAQAGPKTGVEKAVEQYRKSGGLAAAEALVDAADF